MKHNTAFAARTVDGLAQIGRSCADLRGIRFNVGEGGNAPAGAAAAAAAPAPGTPAAAAAAAAATAAAPAAPAPVKFDDLDPTTQGHIRDLRTEAQTNREAKEAAERNLATEQQKLAAVLTTLGINPDGSAIPPTADQLAATLAQSTAATDNTARENLLLRVAPKLGADVDVMLDSRSFTDALGKLKSDDRAGIEALVTEQLGKNPTFKAAPPAAAASGGQQHTGDTVHPVKPTRASLIANHYAKTANK